MTFLMCECMVSKFFAHLLVTFLVNHKIKGFFSSKYLRDGVLYPFYWFIFKTLLHLFHFSIYRFWGGIIWSKLQTFWYFTSKYFSVQLQRLRTFFYIEINFYSLIFRIPQLFPNVFYSWYWYWVFFLSRIPLRTIYCIYCYASFIFNLYNLPTFFPS